MSLGYTAHSIWEYSHKQIGATQKKKIYLSKRYFKFSWFGHFCDEHRIHAAVGSSSIVSRVAWNVWVWRRQEVWLYPFLGQGPFCLHVLSLGNKGQWIALERGQMAGFLPASRLPGPWRPAPGCPAAWSLATSWTTWSRQLHREGCAFVLSFQSGKECGYLQWVCISSEEKPYSFSKILPSRCVSLYTIQMAKILLQIFRKNMTTNLRECSVTSDSLQPHGL